MNCVNAEFTKPPGRIMFADAGAQVPHTFHDRREIGGHVIGHVYTKLTGRAHIGDCSRCPGQRFGEDTAVGYSLTRIDLWLPLGLNSRVLDVDKMYCEKIIILAAATLFVAAMSTQAVAADYSHSTPGLSGYDPVSYFKDGKPILSEPG